MHSALTFSGRTCARARVRALDAQKECQERTALMAELLSYRTGGGKAEIAGAGGGAGSDLFEEHRRSFAVSLLLTLIAEIRAYGGTAERAEGGTTNYAAYHLLCFSLFFLSYLAQSAYGVMA